MFKTLSVIVLSLSALNYCKADTIDYWHVFYNKIRIKEYNQFSAVQTLTFKISHIKKDDSLTVRYFRDTPCFDCQTTLTAETAKYGIADSKHGKGTFNPVTISLWDLVKYKEQNNVDVFDVFYGEATWITKKIALFRIKLE